MVIFLDNHKPFFYYKILVSVILWSQIENHIPKCMHCFFRSKRLIRRDDVTQSE